MKTIETVINEIKVSEELQKKLAEAAKNNAVADFLKELGCDATAEEFINALKPREGELSEDELGAVAGGANWLEALISVVSVGVYCAIIAAESAYWDKGYVETTEGRLLCESVPVGG